jgi:hypothetical protein
LEVTYQVNNLITLLVLVRIFYIFRLIIVLTKFFGDRADRVCKMMGYKLNMHFSFRSLIIRYPIEILTTCTLIIAGALSFMLKILEGEAYYVAKGQNLAYYNDYRTISNSMWNMLVTMTTGK